MLIPLFGLFPIKKTIGQLRAANNCIAYSLLFTRLHRESNRTFNGMSARAGDKLPLHYLIRSNFEIC